MGTRGWRVVVVSPHFDDAVLSVAGHLLRRHGGPAAVVTVFGGEPDGGAPASEWDRLCGFDSPVTAARVRQREDRAACAALGVDAVHLPHPDDPYRPPGAPLDDLVDLLTSALRPGALVLAPAGIGRNPGHVQVRDAIAGRLSRLRDAEVRLYAELPYASAAPDWGTARAGPDCWSDDVPEHLRAADAAGAERVELTPAEWARKREALFSYASQLASLTLGFRRFTRVPGPLQFELTWTISPAARSDRTGEPSATGTPG
jgi:LmbE family N-acetylglucosaminyl deacetylase